MKDSYKQFSDMLVNEVKCVGEGGPQSNSHYSELRYPVCNFFTVIEHSEQSLVKSL